MPWLPFASPPAVTVDRVSGRRGELVLQRRGAAFEIVYNGVLLMASYNGASEAAMARIAYRRWEGAGGGRSRPGGGRNPAAALGCSPAASGPNPPVSGAAAVRHCGPGEGRGVRVLVGGLGMGYTLAAALDLPGVERVDVVELEPAVLAWNRGPLRGLNGGRLDDPRVRLWLADLSETPRLPREVRGCDLLLVDVDNGPERTVLASNRRLYRPRGLLALARLLARGGVLAFWCPGLSPALALRLWRTLGHVVRVPVPDPALPPGVGWEGRRPLPPSQVYLSRPAGPSCEARPVRLLGQEFRNR
ncbi:MAG: hypothetical protein K6T75_03510 [Acetobacteraceae bacterium]|nr:hypothetical protein [Acetobacteraceae bacterium]